MEHFSREVCTYSKILKKNYEILNFKCLNTFLIPRIMDKEYSAFYNIIHISYTNFISRPYDICPIWI